MPGLVVKTIQNTTAMRQTALKLYDLGKPQVMKTVGEMMRDYFTPFVPMRTGKLRKSARYRVSYGYVSLSWGNNKNTAEYAPYQYGGIVYKTNFPVYSNGSFMGWRSKRGATKVPARDDSGRLKELGVQRDILVKYGKTYTLVHLGYRTPGTHHHWVEYGRSAPQYNKFRRDLIKYMKSNL